MDILIDHRNDIRRLCEEHGVEALFVFGSATSGRFDEQSDIDLLVQFGQVGLEEYFDNYMDLKEKLEGVFARPVDLVENQAIRNPIFRQIVDRDKKLIYERKGA